MTETPTEQGSSRASQVVIDDPTYNPFWPKNIAPSDEEAGNAGASNQVDISDVTFNSSNPAQVTVTVTTFPASSAWTIDWGDGGAPVQIAAGTLTANKTYTDTTAGKTYAIKVTSGTDTDTRNIKY